MRVIVLRAGNASTWTGPTGTNTYLLPGAVPTLIDAGVGNPSHLDAVASALDGPALALVLVTHGHPDHASGAGAIGARWPGVRIRMAGSDPVSDDERVAAGDTALRALHTPGHAPDHFCFLHEHSGDLFCGDLARAGGTIVVPGNHGGDLVQYLQSLERIRAFHPKRLLPGHGPIVTDPGSLIDRYVRHRAEREAQIVDALRSGCTTPEQIVPRVYGALAPPLDAAAIESVLAHLIKLRSEGLADCDGGRWAIRR